MALTTALPEAVKEYFALPPSNWNDAKLLAANVAETFVVPDGANFVSLTSTADIYVKFNGTAAVSTDLADGTASELNPTMRRLLLAGAEVTYISVISETAAKVVASYYL